MKERVAKEDWKFIYYTDLERFFNETKGKMQTQIADFEAIFHAAVELPRVEAQARLPLNT